MSLCSVLPLLACGLTAVALAQQDGQITFRSDVALVRVDVQVVDRNNRPITGLERTDFVLREGGKPQEIRQFASEDMPVDVLLLLDVSASMRPHVERIAEASHQALQVLGPDDRVAVMVFDRSTRVRLPFRQARADVERGLEVLLRQEGFNGGTDITRGILDAVKYMERSGRVEARRAIVIVTDDQTERERNESKVLSALTRAETVLSAIITPNAIPRLWGRPGLSWPFQRGPWRPWGGGGIWGPRGPWGIPVPRPYPDPPVVVMPRTQSAGTREIAERSGGDSMDSDEAGALENTLRRLRQRYALFFYLPPDAQPGEDRTIEVDLSPAAKQRYRGAQVRFRRHYQAPFDRQPSQPQISSPSEEQAEPVVDESPQAPRRRRPAVNEPSGYAGPAPAEPGPASSSGQGGWRRVQPGEQP